MNKERKMIGKRMPFQVAPHADTYCVFANRNVVPLFKTFGVPMTTEAIRAVMKDRNTFYQLAIAHTLDTEEYNNQPPLIREAAETLLREKIRTALGGYKSDIMANDADYTRYDPETEQMIPDTAKIDKACEMWVEGETLEVYNDYVAAVDALNKLFNNRVPEHHLTRIMGLSGGKLYSPARVVMDGAPWFHELRRIRANGFV